MPDQVRKGFNERQGDLLGLRSTGLPEGSIEKALGDIRDAVSPDSRTPLCITVLGESRLLLPAVHHQVYGIAREALLNALRYSAASRVEAEIEYLPRKLRVVVRDDGTGVDPETLQTSRSSHWSLNVMRERAASIGAKVRVWSRPEQGTEVEISVPILGKNFWERGMGIISPH